MTGRRAIVVAGVLGALALGFGLRAVESLRTDRPVYFDAPLHVRMTERELDGRLGERDELRFHPEGCVPAEMQPTGLYVTVAWLHRILAPITGDPATTARGFTAAAGALIVVPVFLIARRLWRSDAAGCLAALVVAVMPAHIVRTMACTFRFDAPGILLLGWHLFFLVRLLESPGAGRAGLGTAFLSTATLVGALALWRATVALAGLEIVVIAGLLPLVRSWRPLGVAAVTVALALLLALGVTYYRANGVTDSRMGLAVLWTASAILVASWISPRPGLRRAWIILLVIVAGAIVVTVVAPGTAYDRGEGNAMSVLLGTLGLQEPDDATRRLYALVAELRAPGPALLWERLTFSWVGLLVAAGAARLAMRARRGGRWRVEASVAFLVLLGGGLLMGAMMAERTRGVLAVPAAIAAGGSVLHATGLPGRRRALAVAALGIPVVATILGTLPVIRADARTDNPPLRRISRWIDRDAPPGAAIAGPWDIGYFVQTYGRRPTLTDGHLEDPRNRTRIAAIDAALVAPTEDDLVELFREYRVSALVVDERKLPQAFFRQGLGELTARKTLRLAPGVRERAMGTRIILRPESLRRFVEVHRDPPYRVIALRPGS